MILRKQVADKLNEFGIQIYKEHETQDDDADYVYYAENMILFVNDTERSIGLTFQATTKPERSATLALILNQIKRADIIIMEPFIFNEKNEFIAGKAAYELIEKSDRSKMMMEYNRQQIYADMLEKADCHEC